MNIGNRLYQTFIVIERVDHGSVCIEDDRYGGQHRRYLNITGRWSAQGNRAVPLLCWMSIEEVAAAAAIASEARKAEVNWSSIGGDSLDTRHFAPFGHQHAAALVGYLPYAGTQAKKFAEQRAKTLDFALAVLRVHQATTVEQMRQLEQTEGRVLLQKYRTGVFAARQYLAGKNAAEVLRMLQSGELEADQELSVEDLKEAIRMARLYDSVVHQVAETRRQAR